MKIAFKYFSCVFFFLAIILSFNEKSFAQQNKIDSLLTLLKTDKADTNQVNHLNTLSWNYDEIGSLEKAMLYADSAVQLSNELLKKVSDSNIKKIIQKGEAFAYRNIGLIFSGQGKYPEALRSFLV